MENKNWYQIENEQDVISPSLLVYPKRIDENIRKMIAIAGGTEFLRPHIKTYKIAEIIKQQLKHGIYKFKCATIAEAELLATCGVKDILLAVQPVGIHVQRFFKLAQEYPLVKFSTIVDNLKTVEKINTLAASLDLHIAVYLDINNGMDRTGIWPDNSALELYKTMVSSSNLEVQGFHVYDGHLRHSNIILRKKECNKAFDLVLKLKKDIENAGMGVAIIVAGGSPTFPIHAQRKEVIVSPGTTLLWDQGYSNLFPDMAFLPAAVLFSRVISKPASHLICFDLGHKSVASEMQFPRVKFLNILACEQIKHSEEHLVVECAEPDNYEIGDVSYSIPMHICPTVSKYKEVLTIVERKITGSYQVVARDHKITI